jgi:hypothetical protein
VESNILEEGTVWRKMVQRYKEERTGADILHKPTGISGPNIV